MYPFVQYRRELTTIDCWKEILNGNQNSCLSAFAYVTDSGVAQVKNHLEGLLVGQRDSRWLFGFDYGRTQPAAIRTMAEIGLGNIRIYDGEYVVNSSGFSPRVSFHLKTSLTFLDNSNPNKQVVGSGNLSASGLLGGIEAGGIIDYGQVECEKAIRVVNTLEELWEEATPYQEVIAQYEQRYEEIALPRVNTIDANFKGEARLFWIDVGYVTRNRGPNRPGNQFDLPRGAHVFLGLPEVSHPQINSVLGELRIRTPTGEIVDRVLRFGNNSMEKLTLPIPERFGYHSYDGKYLTFKVRDEEVILNALEQEDFMRVYGTRVCSLNIMQSGRAYGTVL